MVRVSLSTAKRGFKGAPSDTIRNDGMHSAMVAIIDKDIKADRKRLATIVNDVSKGLVRDIKTQLDGPERPYRRTGDLKRGTMMRPGRSDLEKVVYNTMRYAPYVEYGTRRHPAYPFFFPNAIKWSRHFKAAIQKMLRGKR